MFKVVTFSETVRVPPSLFSLKLDKAALKILRDSLERTVDKGLGVIISLHDARITSPGEVLPGDGAAHFDVECKALVFQPVVNEVVEGVVSEIVEFGAFVRLGPIDGLVHVSQVANDFFTYDKASCTLVGRKSRKVLKKGDVVRAKVATVSLKDSVPSSKIALTMRPDGLGKQGGGKTAAPVKKRKERAK